MDKDSGKRKRRTACQKALSKGSISVFPSVPWDRLMIWESLGVKAEPINHYYLYHPFIRHTLMQPLKRGHVESNRTDVFIWLKAVSHQFYAKVWFRKSACDQQYLFPWWLWTLGPIHIIYDRICNKIRRKIIKLNGAEDQITITPKPSEIVNVITWQLQWIVRGRLLARLFFCVLSAGCN